MDCLQKKLWKKNIHTTKNKVNFKPILVIIIMISKHHFEFKHLQDPFEKVVAKHS